VRRFDWPERLAAAVEAARGAPFEWGRHDCATWVCDTVADLTRVASAAEAWRGRYSTAKGSLKVLRRLGWSDLGEMGDALFGARVTPLAAQRGDVAMAGDALGLVVGQSVAVLGEDGLVMVPLQDAVAAWRVA